MPNLLQSVFVHPSHTSSATQNRGINTRTRTRPRFTADLHMPRFAPPSGLLAFSLTFSQGPFPLELRRREPVSGFYCIFSSTSECGHAKTLWRKSIGITDQPQYPRL